MASLVLCGEGPSDFGKEGEYGSLALVVLKALEQLADEMQEEYKMPQITRLYHRNVQPNRIKNAKKPIARRMLYGSGKYSYLRDTAASFAQNHVTSEDIGILHSDVDFLNQEDSKKCYDNVISAIRKGFSLANKTNCCCALVPMPRTEAWLLYLTPENSLSPQEIERLPGNDNSPHAPKMQLCQLGYVTDNCGSQRNRNKKLSYIIENNFEHGKMMKLSSYKQFYEDLSSLNWQTLF